MSQQKPLTLSVIIPVYNEEYYLADCLQSIAKQTILPDEVIVVDNGSTDNTVGVARQFPFVSLIHEPRRGIAFARDAGFNVATGDIIGRIDADSRPLPGWVEHIKRYYRKPERANNSLSGRGYYYNLRWPKAVGLAQHIIAFKGNRLIMGGYILWGSNMAIPRRVWLDVQGLVCHRRDIHEDIDLSIHLKDKGYRVDYRKSMLVGVEMRRVLTDRAELWPNLMWWPRTFRAHHYKTWPLALLGACMLYALTPFALLVEKLAILLGREPHKSKKIKP